MKALICIICPKGCRLQVDEKNRFAVTGNSCPRGAEYGRVELTAPTRVLCSTVRITGALHPRCPVKTDRPIPKGLLPQAMKVLTAVNLAAPVHTGQVVLQQMCGTDANLVVTRDL